MENNLIFNINWIICDTSVLTDYCFYRLELSRSWRSTRTCSPNSHLACSLDTTTSTPPRPSYLNGFRLFRPKHPTYVPNRVRRPSPVSFLQKKDFSHSLKGILFGAVILTIALVNLTLFYGLDVHEHTEVQCRVLGNHGDVAKHALLKLELNADLPLTCTWLFFIFHCS